MREPPRGGVVGMTMPFRFLPLLALLLPGAALALDLHVSPKGDDKASGRAETVSSFSAWALMAGSFEAST